MDNRYHKIWYFYENKNGKEKWVESESPLGLNQQYPCSSHPSTGDKIIQKEQDAWISSESS